nr:histidine--tRNA ligase, cytoplasmic [Tanacetum cinerariifolium]
MFRIMEKYMSAEVKTAGDRRLPKIAKGARDCANGQMVIREKAFSTVANVFKMHGTMALDTPVFELTDTLKRKIWGRLKGGEPLSLRYDLTVPFARYVAMKSLTPFERYQIGKVYRRDTPSKGRYREFYQCDFDIAGDETFGADFEVIIILIEVLDELNIGEYEIKLNHRKLLDGILEICGVPSQKIRTVCSSIDKLDKQTLSKFKMNWLGIRFHIDVKGLDTDTVKKIGSFVKLRGCVHKVVFDLSLARGLDYYYTGVIYEAVFKGATQVGSIAAGGRYDNVIGDMFGRKHVAAIGVSLGIERIITIMEENQKIDKQLLRANETQVLVSIWGDDKFLGLKLVKMLDDFSVINGHLEDVTVKAIRIRSKWKNDDYICRGPILNGMSDYLFDIYTNVESAKELWDSLESKYMAEDSSSKKFLVNAIAWWIDPGATTHVCKDRCWFKTYEPVEDGSVFYMGDDHFAPVHGKGSVTLEFSSGKNYYFV